MEVTGEDPLEAFGPPDEYARMWRPRWYHRPARLLGAFAGALSLPALIVAFSPDDPRTGWRDDVGITASLLAMSWGWIVLAVLTWTLGPSVSRMRSRRLAAGHDTRTTDRYLLLVVIGSLIVVLSLSWFVVGAAYGSREVLFSAPRWVVAAFGLVAVPGWALVFANSSVPNLPRQTRVRHRRTSS